MNDELEKCPFCGDRAEIFFTEDDRGDALFTPLCTNDGFCGAELQEFLSRDEAVEAWNKRVGR